MRDFFEFLEVCVEEHVSQLGKVAVFGIIDFDAEKVSLNKGLEYSRRTLPKDTLCIEFYQEIRPTIDN